MRRFPSMAVLALAAGIAVSATAVAQPLPTPLIEEVMVKTSLLTFNDANITGNYDVMYAKMGKPFRDRYGVQDLQQAFKMFAGQRIDLIAAKPIVVTSPAKINKGVLMLRGYFDVAPSRLTYQLNFAVSEGEWKLIAIDVTGKPAPSSDAGGADMLAHAGADVPEGE